MRARAKADGMGHRAVQHTTGLNGPLPMLRTLEYASHATSRAQTPRPVARSRKRKLDARVRRLLLEPHRSRPPSTNQGREASDAKRARSAAP